MYKYTNKKFWNKTKLWKLRNEITLNSLYISDYYNHFGIPPKIVCDFFDGYIEYLETLVDEQTNIDECKTIQDYLWQKVFNLDSKENLWNWFNCFEVCPFEVDLEYDYLERR